MNETRPPPRRSRRTHSQQIDRPHLGFRRGVGFTIPIADHEMTNQCSQHGIKNCDSCANHNESHDYLSQVCLIEIIHK